MESEKVSDSTKLSKDEADIIEKQAISLYKHVKEISKMKYDSELRREDSLVQQSSNMQTAFAFMTAALFMAAPVIIEYRGEKISLNFVFAAYSSIVFFLMISLIMASLAQRRELKKTFMNIPQIEEFVSNTYKNTLKKSEQLKQWVQVVGDVQVSLERINDKRVNYIRISQYSFFASLLLVILWYLAAIIKMI